MFRFESSSSVFVFLVSVLPISGCTMMELYPPGPATSGFVHSDCLGPQIKPTDCKDLSTFGDPSIQVDDGTIKQAVECTTETRNNFGEFLDCREKKQLLAGFGIVALAAAASGLATAGASDVAAVSLATASTGGLGLEFALYNKPKTKAYSDATVQLQCVAGESAPLENTLAKLTAVPPVDPVLLACLQSDSDLSGDGSLAVAQYTIAKQRADFAQERLQALPIDIVATVQNIDIRAFTAAQSGVPDADQIQKGVTVVSGTSSKTATAPPKGAAVSCSDANLTNLETTTAQLNGDLALIHLPEYGFPDCLALKAVDETSSSPSTTKSTAKQTKKSGSTGSTTGSGQTGNSGSGDGTTPTSDGPSAKPAAAPSASTDSAPQQPLTKVAFQVEPSDHVSVEDGKSTVIKAVGGTPPYYAVIVDNNVQITKATQTDLFVSFEIGLGSGQSGRLLVGDQAGAEEVIYVNLTPSTQAAAPGSAAANGGQPPARGQQAPAHGGQPAAHGK